MAVGSLAGRLLDGLAEVLVSLLFVVGQCLDNVRYTYLQNNVHTAFQVQTQANAHLTAFLQCPYIEIDLVVLQRIQIAVCYVLTFSLCKCLGFALIVIGHEREAQIEEAHQSKQEREKLYKSFVLHCNFK